ncbi:MAG: transposase [Planctomycetes bacterium]|nr:transposase [Planctomycetota bacterium]
MTKADQKATLELVLTKEEAREVIRQGDEAIIFKLLELSKLVQELENAGPPSTSSTPSGQVPVYKKPTTSKSRKKPGQKKGHEGTRRKTPHQIDRHETHSLVSCPHCWNQDLKVTRKRKRVIEDIKETGSEAVEHEIEGSWCTTCKKIVEPVVVDALSKASIGHRVVALTAWLHYGLGNTLSQILEVFNYHLHFKLSAGGLVQMWYRVQEILYTWYEQIGEEARKSAFLHADESGWRVNGKTHWLWCFTNNRLTYYLIDRCRGSPVLFEFLGEVFNGCLITDFWRAYDLIGSRFRQYCLAHLLREIHDVDLRNPSELWSLFRKKLRRLLGDALRLYGA